MQVEQGMATGQELRENAAKDIEICRRTGGGGIGPLLRCHVGGRPQRHPPLGLHRLGTRGWGMALTQMTPAEASLALYTHAQEGSKFTQLPTSSGAGTPFGATGSAAR